MKTVSVDLDGVLACFECEVKKIAISLGYNIPIGYRAPDWEWSDVFTEKDWDRIWEVIKSTENFWLTLSCYRQNVDALKLYQRIEPVYDYESIFYFITSRTPTKGFQTDVQSAKWLRIFGINFTDVIVSENPSKKAGLMRKLGIQYSIDDKPETVMQCNSLQGGIHKAYLLDQPWNKNSDQPRVYSMSEFLEKIKE